jgi:hypothetical protein
MAGQPVTTRSAVACLRHDVVGLKQLSRARTGLESHHDAQMEL